MKIIKTYLSYIKYILLCDHVNICSQSSFAARVPPLVVMCAVQPFVKLFIISCTIYKNF